MTIRPAVAGFGLMGVCLCFGCASYRYSIRPGEDSPVVASTNAWCVNWRVLEDGALLRLNAAMRQAVESEIAKYPSVFAPTGTPVTVIVAPHAIYRQSDGTMSSVDNRPNIPTAFAFVLSAFTLPLCGTEDVASQILITRQKTDSVRLSGPLVLSRDYVERTESRISVLSPLALFFPFFDPEDTAYFRTAHQIPAEDDPTNRSIRWRFVVRRVAERLAEAGTLSETMPEVKGPESEKSDLPAPAQMIELDEIPL